MSCIESCKFCGSKGIIKAGFVNEKQQFRCKACNKRFCNSEDNRNKYEDKVKNYAFVLYTEGNGFRRIARILTRMFDRKVYYQTVVKWLKNKHIEVKKKLELERQKIVEEGAEMVEFDELYALFKKNRKWGDSGLKYGLLLTATECICVRFDLEKGI